MKQTWSRLALALALVSSGALAAGEEDKVLLDLKEQGMVDVRLTRIEPGLYDFTARRAGERCTGTVGVNRERDTTTSMISSRCEERERSDEELRQRCRRADAAACSDLAVRWSEIPSKQADARALLTRACDRGHAMGCGNLGWMLKTGMGGAKDERRTRIYYRRACDGGQWNRCSDLGVMLAEGEGGAVDLAGGRALFARACDHGDLIGCGNLGFSLAKNPGGPTDRAKAKMASDKACTGGNALGCRILGIIYVNGIGVDRDIVVGRKLLDKACALEDAEACEVLKLLDAQPHR